MSTAYRLFGLDIRSEIDLPELVPSAGPDVAEVTISAEPVGSEIFEPGLHMVDGDLLFIVEDVARYRISGGKRIAVEAIPGVPERNVRLFLLGSAFGALLHQRGALPLHANAIEIDGKAVAFMGESGAGKSTLAAWFHDRGYRVLADDVCAISFDAHRTPRVSPGLPRLRLWRDALEGTGRNPDRFERSYAADTSFEKYDVPLATSDATERPLAAVYLLRRGSDSSIVELGALDGAQAIFENTYRGAYLEAAGRAVDHWAAAVELVRSAKIFRIDRPWSPALMDEGAEAILAHVRGLELASSCLRPCA